MSCMFVYLYALHFICLSICIVYVRPSVCLCVRLSVPLSVCLSVRLSVRLSVCLQVGRLSVFLIWVCYKSLLCLAIVYSFDGDQLHAIFLSRTIQATAMNTYVKTSSALTAGNVWPLDRRKAPASVLSDSQEAAVNQASTLL